tara:strand:- start:738 stop:1280 length:543 start_codon:yes stop_codon:yes gene_type:complete
MLLASSTWNSTTAYLRWKIRVTPSKHLLYQLAVSMPRTEGTGSGLSPGKMTPDEETQKSGEPKVDPETMKMWPTPRVSSANGPSQREIDEGNPKYRLETEVAILAIEEEQKKLWPTPRASEWKGVGPLSSKSHIYRLNRYYLDATVQEVEQVSGHLNPDWVETYLMGFPAGWTNLKEPRE